MMFRVSRHAERELLRRKIPRDLLESVLENPDQRIPQPGGKEIRQSRFEFANGKIYLLRVVVLAEKDPPVVVTVYRTSKIGKYWRSQ